MAEPGPSRSGENSVTAHVQLKTDIVRHADIWDKIGITDAMLSRAANAAFDARPVGHAACELTIVLTDDAEMAELNRIWRGKDSSTNVLSFPAGEPFGTGIEAPVPLGDVVLAAETVQAEAASQGIAAADHVSHLVVHGVLHLLGYDHESDEDAAIMERLETQILASLGVADPYAEAGEAQGELAR